MRVAAQGRLRSGRRTGTEQSPGRARCAPRRRRLRCRPDAGRHPGRLCRRLPRSLVHRFERSGHEPERKAPGHHVHGLRTLGEQPDAVASSPSRCRSRRHRRTARRTCRPMTRTSPRPPRWPPARPSRPAPCTPRASSSAPSFRGRRPHPLALAGKALGVASRRLGFAPRKAAPERSGVKGGQRQPPPIGAQRRFVRGSVGPLEAAQRRGHRATKPRPSYGERRRRRDKRGGGGTLPSDRPAPLGGVLVFARVSEPTARGRREGPPARRAP